MSQQLAYECESKLSHFYLAALHNKYRLICLEPKDFLWQGTLGIEYNLKNDI